MIRHAWLIPVQPAPAALRRTAAVLRDGAVPYTLIDPDLVRERLEQTPPLVSIIHGGGLTPQLFDVQRWLATASVPALVLVEGLTDYYEARLLERGARDVVALPASTRKLRSRVEALVRPTHLGAPHPGIPSTVSVGSAIEMHPRQRKAQVNHTPVQLTKSEFDLLLALALSEGDVLARSHLAEAIGKERLSDRALESHISRIRLKLRAAGAPDCIESVRSLGYRLRSAPVPFD